MAVGVGPGAVDSELKSIAMEDIANTMTIGSFDRLAGNVKKITKHLCRGIVEQFVLVRLKIAPLEIQWNIILLTYSLSPAEGGHVLQADI